MKRHFERPKTLEFWRGDLPHWEVSNALHFVTINLTGSIPLSAALKIRKMRIDLERLEFSSRYALQKTIFDEMERWLDRRSSVNYLAMPAIAEILIEAFQYRIDAGIWRVPEFVVMPSHIHFLVEFLKAGLKESLESFKERTARKATKILGWHGQRFWQREWFDHWVRSPEEEIEYTNYIRNNPVKAGLVEDYRLWPYGSWKLR